MSKITVTKIDDKYVLHKLTCDLGFDLDSKALCIFTDFKETLPRVIEGSTSLLEVKNLMIREHVKLKLVIDREEEMVGAISYRDIGSERAILAARENNGIENVEAADVMTPLKDLLAISYSQLAQSSIKDVVHVLQNESTQHAFVVDEKNKEIIGIVSASDIARKLCLPISIEDTPTFHSIFNLS